VEIVLYDEGTAGELDMEEIARYLVQKMGKVEMRGNPFAFNIPPDKASHYAREIAGAKIQEVSREMQMDFDCKQPFVVSYQEKSKALSLFISSSPIAYLLPGMTATRDTT